MASKVGSPRVAVVGGGIIGMSTAVRISHALPDVRVTVIAEKFTLDTTSNGAGGFLKTHLLGKDNIEKQKLWLQETFNFIQKLYVSSISPQIGISLVSGYKLYPSSKEEDHSSFKDVVFGYRHISENEQQLYGVKDGIIPTKISFTTFVTECSMFLPFLMEVFKRSGGKIENRRVERLDELAKDYDIVVNCTGLFAKYLTDDKLLHPIRGQVIRVEAPWIKTFTFSDEFAIIPNQNTVFLGGTEQRGNWSVTVDPGDREHILNGCCKLVPSLRNAKIVQEWIGLRPGRDAVRLETEELEIEPNIKLHVVHNYGHGGSGVSIFWGCAGDVVKMVARILDLPVDFECANSKMFSTEIKI